MPHPTDSVLESITEVQFAERQNRSVKTIQNDRLTGHGVPFVKFGRSVRYRLSDVVEFEDAHLRGSTSDDFGQHLRPATPVRGRQS